MEALQTGIQLTRDRPSKWKHVQEFLLYGWVKGLHPIRQMLPCLAFSCHAVPCLALRCDAVPCLFVPCCALLCPNFLCHCLWQCVPEGEGKSAQAQEALVLPSISLEPWMSGCSFLPFLLTLVALWTFSFVPEPSTSWACSAPRGCPACPAPRWMSLALRAQPGGGSSVMLAPSTCFHCLL